MSDEERNYKDDLRINKYKLEDECENQHNLYNYWATLLADARTNKDRQESKLELLEGKVELKYRSMEDLPGKIKSTEGAIKACIKCDEEIEEQTEKVNNAKSEVYHLEVAVKSFEQRKSDLDNLVTLFVKGFYSQPDGKRRSGTDEAELAQRRNLNRKRGDEQE